VHPSNITNVTGQRRAHDGLRRDSRPLQALTAIILALVITGAGSITALGAPGTTGTTPAPHSIPTSGYCADAEERYFLKLINDFRAQYGRPALRLTQTLGASAEHHSVDMATKNYFSHTLSGGVSWSRNMANHGYTYSTYKGENIAAGAATARQAFTQWQNSSGHRANMLNGNFRAIGIGRAYNASSRYDWYWTTTFGGYQDASFTCRA
jgi:uncharacterized protein YkwD